VSLFARAPEDCQGGTSKQIKDLLRILYFF
jgi:hypothetical protein